jgi:hypothetical protein
MESTLKQVIKEAILEALYEFSCGGVAVASEGEGDGITEGDTGGKDPGTSGGEGNGEGTPEDGEGGKKKDPVEPPVIWPPVGFSLKRK